MLRQTSHRVDGHHESSQCLSVIRSLQKPEDRAIYAQIKDPLVDMDHHGMTVGHYAAMFGHTDVLMAWVRDGGDPCITHPMHPSIMSIGHTAAYHGHWETCDAWIRAGGNVHMMSDDGHRWHQGLSIGHVAALGGSEACLDGWFRAGGNPHVVTSDGYSIGMLMVTHDAPSLACFQRWIDAGGDVHRDTAQGMHIMEPIVSMKPSEHRHVFLRALMQAGACPVRPGGTWRNLISCIADMPSMPDADGVIVTKMCLEIMGHRISHPDLDHRHRSVRADRGRDVIHRFIMHAEDPLHMAAFAALLEAEP
jgi:hypothetical protein